MRAASSRATSQVASFHLAMSGVTGGRLTSHLTGGPTSGLFSLATSRHLGTQPHRRTPHWPPCICAHALVHSFNIVSLEGLTLTRPTAGSHLPGNNLLPSATRVRRCQNHNIVLTYSDLCSASSPQDVYDWECHHFGLVCIISLPLVCCLYTPSHVLYLSVFQAIHSLSMIALSLF